MRAAAMLTTTEAAEIAAVAPSTIKRWADQGVLPFSRTVGGHRRFERFAIEKLLRKQPVAGNGEESQAAAWVRCLVEGQRYEIDGRLLEARGRLGAWWRVADELAASLEEMGKQWQSERLTVADEHMASDAMARALARVGDTLPSRLNGPKCILACGGDEEHTLGLSLAELCLRELGWTPLWLGRRTPTSEVVRLVRGGGVSMVALSASTLVDDEQLLRAVVDEVGAACEEARVRLMLGGSGAWPSQPTFGVRVSSFSDFHSFLTEEDT